MPLGTISAEIGKCYGVPARVVWEDLCALVCELDRYALLTLHRSWRTRIVHLPKRLTRATHPLGLVMGLLMGWDGATSFAARRFRPSPLGLLAACLRAHWWLYASFLGLSVGLVLVLYWLEPPPTVVHWWLAVGVAMIKPVTICTAFLLLVVVHEAAHAGALMALRRPPYYFVVRGGSVAVAHGSVDRTRQAAVGAVGPTAAFGASALAALLATRWLAGPLGLSPVDAGFPLVLGAIHLLALGPWTSDGRAIWTLVRAHDTEDPT